MTIEISDKTTDSVIEATNEALHDLKNESYKNDWNTRHAVEGFRDILIEIVNANDNTIDWFDKLRDFDFRSGEFNNFKRRFNRLVKTTGYRQLKWSCTLISEIYGRQIDYQLNNIIKDPQKRDEIRRVFNNLKGSDERMIEFVKGEILKELADFVEQVQPYVDNKNFYVAEQIQEDFKNDTQDLYKQLVRKSDELSDIIDDFSGLVEPSST